jgi:hypothetical protein
MKRTIRILRVKRTFVSPANEVRHPPFTEASSRSTAQFSRARDLAWSVIDALPVRARSFRFAGSSPRLKNGYGQDDSHEDRSIEI